MQLASFPFLPSHPLWRRFTRTAGKSLPIGIWNFVLDAMKCVERCPDGSKGSRDPVLGALASFPPIQRARRVIDEDRRLISASVVLIEWRREAPQHSTGALMLQLLLTPVLLRPTTRLTVMSRKATGSKLRGPSITAIQSNDRGIYTFLEHLLQGTPPDCNASDDLQISFSILVHAMEQSWAFRILHFLHGV